LANFAPQNYREALESILESSARSILWRVRGFVFYQQLRPLKENPPQGGVLGRGPLEHPPTVTPISQTFSLRPPLTRNTLN